MNAVSFLKNIERIWAEDRVAVVIAAFLVVVQLMTFGWVYACTWRPLGKARRRIEELRRLVKPEGMQAADALAKADTKLAAAWMSVFAQPGGPASPDSADPYDAFDAPNLLPEKYHARWDAAAPGLFTALGILGTFAGLIVGFLRVDATNATSSVGPLIGGMVVAFVNSFVGVFLSIVWSLFSRHGLQRFARACDQLANAVTSKVARQGVGEAFLAELRTLNARLGAVEGAIGAFHKSSEESSRLLLENLGNKVGDSFRHLVSMPFDQLNQTVLKFDEVVNSALSRHDEMNTRLDEASLKLGEAQSHLTASVVLAKECVDEFSTSTIQFREVTVHAGKVLENTQEAAAGLRSAADEVLKSAARYDEVAGSLETAVGAMNTSASALEENAARFERASGHLEGAVTTIETATERTVEHSVAAIRRELEAAIGSLVQGLTNVSKDTIVAYTQSSEAVVRTIEERMSDLNDRLSAELTTLSQRLPAEVESLNEAMKDIRTQIKKATAGMNDAVTQLAQRTPEALKAQLDVYDEAVALAIDQFNGTLKRWDDKLGVIESFTVELGKYNSQTMPPAPTPTPPPVS